MNLNKTNEVENILLAQFNSFHDAQDVDSKTAFSELGLNSMDALQFVGSLQNTFPELPLTIFLECHNISDLSQYLIENYPNEVKKLGDEK